jgi:hypothetical protein
MKIALHKKAWLKRWIALGFIGALSACEKFLDEPPQGAITEEAIRTTPSAAEDLVTGVYNALWDGDVHGFNYVGVTNIPSDDADKGSSPADGATSFGRLDNLDMDASVGILNNVWSGYYRSLARANQALDKIPLSPVGAAVQARLQGEVRFLRAYFYFNLVRLFGGVPRIDRVPSPAELNNPQFQTRAPAPEIYDLIVSDLRYAVKYLPIKGQSATGRATKGAAMGLLAKVWLYRQDYQRALNLSDSIVAGHAGPYDLLPSYENIWREAGNNSVESLFEVQTGVNTACNAAIALYSVSQGPRAGGKRGWADLGFGFGTPSQSLLGEYEPGDRRLAATIIFINPPPLGTRLWDGYRVPSRDSVENDRYNYKAYHSRTAERNCGVNDRLPKNLRILRYGEVLLIHAEAAFALGQPGVALTDINRLRLRAGLPGLTAITREAIWHERRLELALEHDRFFDLVRQEAVQPGRAVEAFAAHGKTFTRNKNEVFPIPSTQIQLSGGALMQNPGYQ